MITAHPTETTARQYRQAAVPGAFYRTDWLATGECTRIFKRVDSIRWGAREHCRDYGYGRDGTGLQYIGPLPNWLVGLAERLRPECGGTPTQCTVEALLPRGSSRRSEVEIEEYGPVVTIVSLSTTRVCFELVGEVGGKHRREILLAPGSLLLLTGDSRYRWTYKVRPESNKQPCKQRGILLTFRTIRV